MSTKRCIDVQIFKSNKIFYVTLHNVQNFHQLFEEIFLLYNHFFYFLLTIKNILEKQKYIFENSLQETDEE